MLNDPNGKRLYLTETERLAFLSAASKSNGDIRSFCETLHYTGCRISEALSLTVDRIDFENQSITFETLKKRRRGVYRTVPVPPVLLNTLELVHSIRGSSKLDQKLWHWSRTTAWRHIKKVMKTAEIANAPQASPKGLRHGYGVHAISSGIPINMLSKWMGHSSLEVTSIYANALGEEQKMLAQRMWQ